MWPLPRTSPPTHHLPTESSCGAIGRPSMSSRTAPWRAGFPASCEALTAVPACHPTTGTRRPRSEEHTSELQSRQYLVCRLLLEKKKKSETQHPTKKTNHAGMDNRHVPTHVVDPKHA